MANTIKIKRGASSDINSTSLQQGELAITTDTNELYVGNSTGKTQLTYKLAYGSTRFEMPSCVVEPGGFTYDASARTLSLSSLQVNTTYTATVTFNEDLMEQRISCIVNGTGLGVLDVYTGEGDESMHYVYLENGGMDFIGIYIDSGTKLTITYTTGDDIGENTAVDIFFVNYKKSVTDWNLPDYLSTLEVDLMMEMSRRQCDRDYFQRRIDELSARIAELETSAVTASEATKIVLGGTEPSAVEGVTTLWVEDSSSTTS